MKRILLSACLLAALSFPCRCGPTPGGGRIAFVSDRDGNAEIYVMNADGSGQTNLTNSPAPNAFPSWGP
jgi:TolB protein